MADADPTNPDLIALLDQLRAATADARVVADQSQPGTQLAATSSLSPEAIKSHVATQRSALLRKTDELKILRDAVEARVRAELHAAYAAIEPLRRQISRLEEVVWTVNLYTGRDEEIVTLLDEDPAAADTPICVRQMVLSMDEESTIAASRGGMDFRDLNTFDQWVTNPVHLQQVLPEPRGVVVLVPRRRGRDYGDPLVTAKLNEENRRSYWLIRNGDRVFRMTTDFPVGDRLIPTQQEFQSYFTETRFNSETRQHERVPLQPGSSAWLQAEENASSRRRHYMRAALILQGLIDRTTVFAPLPAPSVSLLTPHSYDAGHVQLICDAEKTLPPGRTPFYQWLAERNSTLRPGMRIVGAFDSKEFHDMRSRETGFYGEHERLRPLRTEDPPSATIHTIEDRRDDGGLVIRYARSEQVRAQNRYGYPEYREPQVRASCVLYPTDTFVLPIDLVTTEEMYGYLNSRTERHAYTHMLPLLVKAIELKHAEQQAEAPFLDLLAGQIALACNVPLDEATDAVADLVAWWKLTTCYYRPLIHDDNPEAEARAIKAITTEFAARRRAAAQTRLHAERDTKIVGQVRASIPDVMLIARTRDGSYLAVSPQPRTYPEQVAIRNFYAREHRIDKTGTVTSSRDWVVLTQARIDKWTILWTGPQWNDWNLNARKGFHLTDPEIDTLLTHLREHAATHTTLIHQPGVPTVIEPTGTPILISAAPDRTGRATFRIYLDSGHDLQIPEQLLTGRIPSVSARMLRLNWHRTVGGTPVYDISTTSYEKIFDIRRPWATDETRPPWHDEAILWTAPAVARLQQQAQLVRAAHDRAAELRSAAAAVHRTISDAWEARAEHTAYTRFLEDYLDVSLWEGHRKTLTGLRFPHHQHRGLTQLVDRLIEDGHDLTAHTVATAATLLDERCDLPDDILDLPLTGPTNNNTP